MNCKKSQWIHETILMSQAGNLPGVISVDIKVIISTVTIIGYRGGNHPYLFILQFSDIDTVTTQRFNIKPPHFSKSLVGRIWKDPPVGSPPIRPIRSTCEGHLYVPTAPMTNVRARIASASFVGHEINWLGKYGWVLLMCPELSILAGCYIYIQYV